MAGLFKFKKDQATREPVKELGNISIFILIDQESIYYSTVDSATDVKRVESWIYNLFHAYFAPKYEGVFNFRECFCSGSDCIISINFNIENLTDFSVQDITDEDKVNKILKELIDNFITFKKFVNQDKTENGELKICGFAYNVCGISREYNELNGENEDKLYRGVK